MTNSDINQIARTIIRENKYLTLATADGEPWAAPLFYCVDDQWNFYFISQIHSRHIQHILKNPNVAFAIFDSHQEEGKGNGVQGSGSVKQLEESELDEAFRWYRTSFVEMNKESFTGDAPYRFFKLIPKKLYVLDPEAKVDKRVEVFVS